MSEGGREGGRERETGRGMEGGKEGGREGGREEREKGLQSQRYLRQPRSSLLSPQSSSQSQRKSRVTQLPLSHWNSEVVQVAAGDLTRA